MKHKIIWKFLAAFISLIFIGVWVLNYFVSLKLRDYYEEKIYERLANNALLVGDILKDELLRSDKDVIQQETMRLAEDLGLRISVLDKTGKVLGDSEKNPALMQNHANRIEIIEAIRGRFGESVRFSDTLGYNMKYVASSLKDGSNLQGVIRLAMPLSEIEHQISFIYRIVLLGGIVTVILTIIIGYFVSRSVSRPISEMKEIAERIAKGDFTKKVSVDSQDELGELGKSLNEMSKELQHKMENLKKMDRVRTDFVANVSHELKTPLTAMKGFIETLEDGAIDDKENAGRFIGIIKKHTERLHTTVQDLLTLTELEAGYERVEKEKLDFKDFVEEVVLGFGHSLSSKRLKLETKFLGDDFSLHVVKSKIEQILVNLIDNAVKYTGQGGHIKVSVYDRGDHIIFSVEDDGIGIPREHLGRIFERFYRVDKARSREVGGTGLGLSIAKHSTLLHNGNIEIASEPGKNTKVIVTLPR